MNSHASVNPSGPTSSQSTLLPSDPSYGPSKSHLQRCYRLNLKCSFDIHSEESPLCNNWREICTIKYIQTSIVSSLDK